MPDNPPIDPMLLRMMRGVGQKPTPGAGAFGDNPNLLRQLQNMQPRTMGGTGKGMPGFNPARPGAGATIKPHQMEQDNTVQGEFPPGELQSLFKSQLDYPVKGGNISADRLEKLPYMGANDSKNILQQRLDAMRHTKSDEQQYQNALSWQRMSRAPASDKSSEPTFKSSMTPIKEDIKPRSPLDIKQIHGVAAKLEAKGLKEDAAQARNYNFKTEQYRDSIKDYNLAKTDLQAWVNKNSVPDLHAGFEDMDRINSLLVKGKQPTLTFPEYQQMKVYELQRKLQQTGQEKFYADLKTNLTTMHSDLDRIHKLIEDHKD